MCHKKVDIPYKLKASIIIVSTSRFEAKLKSKEYTDVSGDLIEESLINEGIEIVLRDIVLDSPSAILDAIRRSLYLSADLIIISGGSGVSYSDISYDTIKSIIDSELISYPILYTSLSYEEVSTHAIASRVIAGFIRDTLVFLIPGSPNAVKTALKIILKEYKHLIWLRRFNRR